MLKSALPTLAHPTEGEAPLLNTICLGRGAAKSQDYWRGWGSGPQRRERGIKGKFDALHPEWRPAGGTNQTHGFNARTAESELQERSTAD
nr:unnamed protein product [Rangifer tarandus platyrhynchus]